MSADGQYLPKYMWPLKKWVMWPFFFFFWRCDPPPLQLKAGRTGGSCRASCCRNLPPLRQRRALTLQKKKLFLTDLPPELSQHSYCTLIPYRPTARRLTRLRVKCLLRAFITGANVSRLRLSDWNEAAAFMFVQRNKFNLLTQRCVCSHPANIWKVKEKWEKNLLSEQNRMRT